VKHVNFPDIFKDFPGQQKNPGHFQNVETLNFGCEDRFAEC